MWARLLLLGFARPDKLEFAVSAAMIGCTLRRSCNPAYCPKSISLLTILVSPVLVYRWKAQVGYASSLPLCTEHIPLLVRSLVCFGITAAEEKYRCQGKKGKDKKAGGKLHPRLNCKKQSTALGLLYTLATIEPLAIGACLRSKVND